MNMQLLFILFSILSAGVNPHPKAANIYKNARIVADLSRANFWGISTNPLQWCVLEIRPGSNSGAVHNPNISMDTHGNIIRNSSPQKSFVDIAGNWTVLVGFGKENFQNNSGIYHWRKDFRLYGTGRDFGPQEYFPPFFMGKKSEIISKYPPRMGDDKISPAYMLPGTWVEYFDDGITRLREMSFVKIDPEKKSRLFSSNNPIVSIALWRQFGLPHSRSEIARQLSQGDMYRQAILFYLLMFNQHVAGDNLLAAAESVIKKSKKANEMKGIGLATFTVQLSSSRLPDDKKNVCEKLASLIQQHSRTLEHDPSWKYLNMILEKEKKMGVELN